jgi:RNA 2',3'-cyclic 3'-phosphodiesterase
MKIRSFLAFNISDEMKSELKSIIGLIAPKIGEVRWVQDDLMHCTLRFFGEVEEELLFGKLSDTIEREVRHQSPIELVGRGIGVFPNWRYPKVLWAGLTGDTEAMISLHAKLEEAFKALELKPDPRNLRLHLTLARAKKSSFKGKDQLMPLVEKLVAREFGEIRVDQLILYKSELTPEGPNYIPLRTFALGGGRTNGK